MAEAIGERDDRKNDKKREFTMELINFFKSSICGTANSVKILAEIEQKHPEEYNKFRDSKIDPSRLDEIMEGMDQKAKDIFLVIFARASYIAPKLNRLFDLTLEEKKELAKTIDRFAKFVEEKLTELAES